MMQWPIADFSLCMFMKTDSLTRRVVTYVIWLLWCVKSLEEAADILTGTDERVRTCSPFSYYEGDRYADLQLMNVSSNRHVWHHHSTCSCGSITQISEGRSVSENVLVCGSSVTEFLYYNLHVEAQTTECRLCELGRLLLNIWEYHCCLLLT